MVPSMRPLLLAVGISLTTFGLVFLSRPAATDSNDPAPPAAVAPQKDPAVIDAIAKEALQVWQVPGVAVGIVRDDKVVYLKGFGVKEAGRADPVTPDTLFPIASCTKAFTTTAMAMLVDEGKMRWDDPVRKHVPFFQLSDPAANALVTLRDLVSHRTGVGSNDFLWYRIPWGREEAIRRIGQAKLKYPFRSGFQYQTTMFTTAGHAVELTSDSKWEEFIRKRICEPLHLSSTCFTTTEALNSADHASPHRRTPQGGVQSVPWYTIERPEPAGSINTTARDLTQWLRFQLGDGTFEGKRLVSAENLAQTHTPQNIIPMEGSARWMNPDTTQMSYGMAWVIQDYHGRQLISHAGAIDGFRAHLAMVPDAKLGIVLLNNLHQTWMNLAISNRVIDLLLGLPSRDWNAYVHEQLQKQENIIRARFEKRYSERRLGTRPSRELQAYAGTYEVPAYGKCEVVFRDGALVWKWAAFTCELEHFHFDTFLVQNDLMGYPQAVFTLDKDGDVSALRVTEPFDVEFKKTKPKPKK